MKIYEQYVKYETETPRVSQASYELDFAIRLTFTDGVEKVVGFKEFIFNSPAPDMKKYRSEEYFKGFKLVSGNLNWYDYELIFPLSSLYSGKLEAI